jgi:hypothetical protein
MEGFHFFVHVSPYVCYLKKQEVQKLKKKHLWEFLKANIYNQFKKI